MSDNTPNPRWIKASPTKAFFIHMLTRDVPLTRAILDLVDNCVDGAKRECPNNDFRRLWVRLELTKDHFKISDNCGGFSPRIAREYAFRFGRPDDAEETLGSIGQFGVGMKRSFFKLGRKFSVDSTTREAKFLIVVDVDEWLRPGDSEKTADWHFEFSELNENRPLAANEEAGTNIVITGLRDTIGESFELENFRNKLIDEISQAHSTSMDKGLAITLNGIPIAHTPQKFLRSDLLQPAFLEKSYPRSMVDGGSEPPVNVKLYAGIAERNLNDGGWYVFCNGRLILRADKTSITVWGAANNLRQYHPDYAYFRGFVYFDSDHAALLPWTTTKTGVDVDSKIYRIVQQEMITMTRPILEFLNRLERERRAKEMGESESEPLKDVITAALEVRAESITAPSQFVAPTAPPSPPGPQYQRIQYNKPLELVNKVKRLLGVSSFTAVGEKTFDYYLKQEDEG